MPRVNFEPGAPRLALFTCAQTLIGFLTVVFFVDFDPARFRFWAMGLFSIVIYSGAVYFDLSENRRIASNLEGLLFIPALFLLSPAEIIIGRVLGGHFGSRHNVGTPYKVWFNTAAQFMVIAAIVAVTDRVLPDRSIATSSVEIVAIVGLVVGGVYTAFMPVWSVGFSIGTFGSVRRSVLKDGQSTMVVVVIEFALGTLVAMAMVTSPWMFGPLLVVFGLLMYLGYRSARHWVLRTGMDHILELTRSASRTSHPEETFSSVLRSVDKLGAVEDVVIAHIDEHDQVTFSPQPGPIIAREASSGPRLRSLASQGSLSMAAFASKAGALGVWPLSETTDDYLIAYADRKMVSLRNFWQAVDILSQHAALVHTTTSQRAALEQQAQAAHDKARTDETTGMPNRLALVERLDLLIESQARFVVVGVRIHGLANLKQVLGEQAANSDLRDFVGTVLDRDDFAFVARASDDVFVLLSSADTDTAVEAALRIVASDKHLGDSVRAVAAGVVEVDPTASCEPEGVLSDCWVALARAERYGLKVARFDDMDAEAARRRFAIGKSLPAAIEQGQIFPVFQPQIAIDGGSLIGCEVLARWTHPELGFVSPVEFIEVAEQGNMIEPLTESILAAAFAARARWIDQGISVQLSVNVSARSLLQPAFIEHVAELFEQAGLGDDELTVEITESTIAEDDTTTAESLELLHRIGATISIDDFGTGYSALAYLHRLPVDEVKIDKSMVMALGQERDPTDVMAGLIKICHRLNIRVVAEGVETEDALARLDALDCDIAQGYFFAKPMNEEEWCAWAKDWVNQTASNQAPPKLPARPEPAAAPSLGTVTSVPSPRSG